MVDIADRAEAPTIGEQLDKAGVSRRDFIEFCTKLMIAAPVGLAITRDRKLAFVALGPANRVAVIDAQSYEVMRYLLVGQRVWSLAFNPDQSRLYTTNGVSNDITVIDVASLKAIKSVPVGQSPWGVVSRP